MQGDDDGLGRIPQGLDCNFVLCSGVFSAYVLDTGVFWVLRLVAACVVPWFAL